MRAEIKSINDSEITLKMIDPINERKLEETEWRGRNFAYLELFDSRYSSPRTTKALLGFNRRYTRPYRQAQGND